MKEFPTKIEVPKMDDYEPGEAGLRQALEDWRDLTVELADVLALANEIEEFRKACQKALKELGPDALDVPGVTQKWRNGYTATRVDKDLVKGFALAHPGLRDAITDVEVSPSVSIGVEE